MDVLIVYDIASNGITFYRYMPIYIVSTRDRISGGDKQYGSFNF